MKIIIFLISFFFVVQAQTITVEKVSGSVYALIGTSENLTKISENNLLPVSTLIIAEEKSSVLIKKDDRLFLLQGAAAIAVERVSPMSIEELLMALALDDILSVPRREEKNRTISTAVYGSRSDKEEITFEISDLGFKKIEGALQLAESNYKESALIYARETFRKHPETALNSKHRLYFADVLYHLNLFNEAIDEYQKISSLYLTSDEVTIVQNRLNELRRKLGQ